MNIAEILRGLADKLDGIQSQGGSEIPHQDQSAQLHPAEVSNDENSEVNTDSMVSPLQQKLELLKKAAGVENSFDDEGGECGVCGDEAGAEGDALDVMKRNAGLPVMVQLSAEDNDIEG